MLLHEPSSFTIGGQLTLLQQLSCVSPKHRMSDTHQLKKKLVRGAVTDNEDVILGRYPRMERLAKNKSRSRFLLPILLLLALSSAPFLAAAVSPDLTEQYAAWVFQLPGANAVRGALAAPTISEHDRQALDDSSYDPLNENVITVSASDSIEDLDLRFDEPPRIAREVFSLPLQRIIIDPGHGGNHLGTSAGALLEKEITLDLGLRVRDILEEAGVEVFMTRVDDSLVELDDRVRFANESHGDVFLSIHVNWLGDRALRGIETFHLGATDDPEINRRASLENRESGYSLTDFRRLLDGIYVDIRRDESRAFARHIHRSMVGALRQQNPNLRDRGVKQAPFMVLIGTEMPAVLAEVSALNNREEAQLLRTDTYRSSIANALAGGVLAYAEALRPGIETQGPAPDRGETDGG